MLMVSLNKISTDRYYSMRTPQTDGDPELVRDLLQHGLCRPVVLVPYQSENEPEVEYQIFEGFRRVDAFRFLDWWMIPAEIVEN